MSKTQLNIPPVIRVGVQEREGTYTGKLGYVIYYDAKGKIRKETSFENWRHKAGEVIQVWENGKYRKTGVRGDEFNPVNYDNVPTEGFVMNKKAGGTSWGWSHNTRQTKCRIFDPRGFEIEISIENLLFILQETNSIKGKGLEGEFVYSWDGKDMLLLPVGSEEYTASSVFTSLKTMKITKADMIEGYSYLTKDQIEVVYLGRYPWYETIGRNSWSSNKSVDFQKQHIFVYADKVDQDGGSRGKYMLTKGFTNLAKVTSTEEVGNYAVLFDAFSKSKFSTKPVGLVTNNLTIKFPQVKKEESNWYGYGYNDKEAPKGAFYLREKEGVYNRYAISPVKIQKDDSSSSYYNLNNYIFKGYELLKEAVVTFTDKKITVSNTNESSGYGYRYRYERHSNVKKGHVYTQEEIQQKGIPKSICKVRKWFNSKTKHILKYRKMVTKTKDQIVDELIAIVQTKKRKSLMQKEQIGLPMVQLLA